MSEEIICKKIFDKYGKPDNYLMCRAINVYDNKYRVNIYSKTDVEGIEGKRISASYFIKYDNNTIVSL